MAFGESECKPMELVKMQAIEEPTLTIKLRQKKERLEAELAKVTEVLNTVIKHPEVQTVFDAVSSIRGLI